MLVAAHMSSGVAGVSTTPRPTASPLNRPSKASWVSGVGRTGGALATCSARVSNTLAQGLPGVPMIS